MSSPLPQLVNTFGQDLLHRYGRRVHKIAINAGFTCPNRDGSKGRGGCSFCNNVSFSPHARRAVREADVARRVMFAARETQSLPKGFSDALMTVHGRRPFPDGPDEIAQAAAAVKDPNFRVQVSGDGIHVYNRDGLFTHTDPFELYPELGLEADGGHAFYMGVELARAEIAFQLGKRYVQDRPLDWGCAADRVEEDLLKHRAPGTTLRRRRTPAKSEDTPPNAQDS